jgi:hypothetical protein
MCFDASRGKTVLFAGETELYFVVNDTWEWDGHEWALRASQGPAGRQSHTLTYDSHHRESVLFAGYRNYGLMEYRDVWTWNGTNWTLRSQDSIGRRYFHAMVYDESRRRSIMFGGYNGFQYQNDTSALAILSPGIVEEPSDTSVPPASTVLFHVEAEGTEPFAYQWRRNGTPLQNHAHYHGVTTPTLRIQPATPPNAGLYDCVITNDCGTITTTPARLTIVTGHGGGHQASDAEYSTLSQADADGDGDCDVDDLLAVILGWGPCPPSPVPCPADIAPLGGDGQVNIDDLIAVILNWGA